MSRDRYDTIIFDLDGTLLDTAQDVLKAINHALLLLDRNPTDLDQVKRAIGPNKDTFLNAVLPGASPEAMDIFISHFRMFYWDHCLDDTQLFPGMEHVLNGLAGKTLAVATNKPRKYSVKILEGRQILDRFRCVVGPEDVSHPKPHPEMIVNIMKSVEATPSRTLIVGDTEQDMRAGRSAGVGLCCVRYGYGDLDRIRQINPEYFIERPEEILEIVANHSG